MVVSIATKLILVFFKECDHFGWSPNKIYDYFLLKNVHRTEIDKVEPKLWKFTFRTLILGHPVAGCFSAEPLRLTRHSSVSYCIDVQGIQPYLQVQATLAAAVGSTDRYLRPIPRQHATNQGAPKHQLPSTQRRHSPTTARPKVYLYE